MYSSLDKYEFVLKDAKSAIGMGRGNSLSTACNFVKDNPLYKDLTEEQIKLKIEELWDYLFHASQVKIEQDYTKWLATNKEKLIKHFDIRDIVENQGEKIIDLEEGNKLWDEKKQKIYNQDSEFDEINKQNKEAEK